MSVRVVRMCDLFELDTEKPVAFQLVNAYYPS